MVLYFEFELKYWCTLLTRKCLHLLEGLDRQASTQNLVAIRVQSKLYKTSTSSITTTMLNSKTSGIKHSLKTRRQYLLTEVYTCFKMFRALLVRLVRSMVEVQKWIILARLISSISTEGNPSKDKTHSLRMHPQRRSKIWSIKSAHSPSPRWGQSLPSLRWIGGR